MPHNRHSFPAQKASQAIVPLAVFLLLGVGPCVCPAQLGAVERMAGRTWMDTWNTICAMLVKSAQGMLHVRHSYSTIPSE